MGLFSKKIKIEIYMKCPACMAEGYNAQAEYWRDSKPCYGKLYLDDKAIVHCAGCGNTEHLSKMRLRCGNNRHYYAVSSIEGFAAAISTAGEKMTDSVGLAWLQKAISTFK